MAIGPYLFGQAPHDLWSAFQQQDDSSPLRNADHITTTFQRNSCNPLKFDAIECKCRYRANP